MKKGEREAAAKIEALLERQGKIDAKRGEAQYGGEYGAGKLTKDQRKSQERHIPMTPAPSTRGQKIARKLWG